jgi:hypothetical protein
MLTKIRAFIATAFGLLPQQNLKEVSITANGKQITAEDLLESREFVEAAIEDCGAISDSKLSAINDQIAGLTNSLSQLQASYSTQSNELKEAKDLAAAANQAAAVANQAAAKANQDNSELAKQLGAKITGQPVVTPTSNGGALGINDTKTDTQRAGLNNPKLSEGSKNLFDKAAALKQNTK